MALPEGLYGKSLDSRGVISSSPCVVISMKSGLFLEKGWKWYREMEFVKDWQDARVFQNSAGAKNAVIAAIGSGNIDDVVELEAVIELKDEIEKWRRDTVYQAAKEFNRLFKIV